MGKEKLEIVGAMAKRMIRAAGIDCEVRLTLDRREALIDADFVTTQFRVGQLDARIKDETIPLRYDMIGQETNGAGGMLKAFRTIPVVLEIVEDMKELCPQAWLINFTNPAGMVTEAVLRYGEWEKVIGLCNVPIIAVKNEAAVLEMDEEALFFKFAGINHLHWHRVYGQTGDDLTEVLIDKLYGPDAKPEKLVENIKEMRFLQEQIAQLKMLPCPYHRYYYMTDSMLREEQEEAQKKEHEVRLLSVWKRAYLNYIKIQISITSLKNLRSVEGLITVTLPVKLSTQFITIKGQKWWSIPEIEEQSVTCLTIVLSK